MATKKLVQYVAIRRDLSSSLSWPAGAVIAQACHACTAVIVSYIDDPNTCEYTKELDRMHKVVVEVQNIFVPSKLLTLSIFNCNCEFFCTYLIVLQRFGK